MGWVTEKAKRISEKQRELQDARQWELHAAEVIKREVHLFFERICEQITQDVNEFNQEHGEADPVYCERLGKIGSGFNCEVGIGDQIAEGQQGSPVGWHTSMVRRD
jgi:hypothetical protein